MIVENGTVVANANSYVTITEADNYLRDRARATTWDTYTTAQKEAHLIQATDYIDANVKWKGERRNEDQSLGWPRSNVTDRYGQNVDPDVVPLNVRRAVIEVAALGTPSLTVSRLAARETVGPVTVEYERGDPSQSVAKHKHALALLAGYVSSSAGTTTIRLVRA